MSERPSNREVLESVASLCEDLFDDDSHAQRAERLYRQVDACMGGELTRRAMSALSKLIRSNQQCIIGTAKGQSSYWDSFECWLDRADVLLEDDQ